MKKTVMILTALASFTANAQTTLGNNSINPFRAAFDSCTAYAPQQIAKIANSNLVMISLNGKTNTFSVLIRDSGNRSFRPLPLREGKEALNIPLSIAQQMNPNQRKLLAVGGSVVTVVGAGAGMIAGLGLGMGGSVILANGAIVVSAGALAAPVFVEAVNPLHHWKYSDVQQCLQRMLSQQQSSKSKGQLLISVENEKDYQQTIRILKDAISDKL